MFIGNSIVKPILQSVIKMLKLAWQSNKYILTMLIILDILSGLVPLINAWIMKEIFDLLSTFTQQSQNINFIDLFIPFLLLQGLVTLLSIVIGHLNTFLQGEMGRQLRLTAQTTVFEKLAYFNGLKYFEDPIFNNKLRMAHHGVYAGPFQILSTLTNLVKNIVTVLGFLATLLILSPWLLVVIIFVSVPRIISQMNIAFRRYNTALHNGPKERKISYYSELLSNQLYIKEVKFFGLSNFFLNKLISTIHNVQKTERQLKLHEFFRDLGFGTISGLINSSVLIFVVLQAYLGEISLGDVALFMSALVSIQGSINVIIYATASLSENSHFYKNFDEVIALPEDLVEVTDPKSINSLQHNLSISNLSFRYSENQPWILKNINLNIPRGKCLCIVGANGAGKTTLVKLLARLYDPVEGSIRWDSIDIRNFDVDQYRKCISIIFQDFLKYDLTAEENIQLGNIYAVNEFKKIHRVANLVNIHQDIESLPKGYQTTLSQWLVEDEDGVMISGGQWQKLALARMLIRNADLLIFDEPTSAIDANTEYKFFQEIKSISNEKTIIIISHRFSTIQIADYIAVLENSKIVEYGTHTELMGMRGSYFEMYLKQTSNRDVKIL